MDKNSKVLQVLRPRAMACLNLRYFQVSAVFFTSMCLDVAKRSKYGSIGLSSGVEAAVGGLCPADLLIMLICRGRGGLSVVICRVMKR
jgi:hypothetical protein